MGISKWLRRNDDASNKPQDAGQVREAVERVMTLNPRLGMARHCRKRLVHAVTGSLQYASDLVATLPVPHEASARTWASDLYMRAFFAAPGSRPPLTR
jgi:hypothetical protein